MVLLTQQLCDVRSVALLKHMKLLYELLPLLLRLALDLLQEVFEERSPGLPGMLVLGVEVLFKVCKHDGEEATSLISYAITLGYLQQ